MGRKPCGTELFTYGIWCVISRCSVRTELNCVVVLVLSCVWLLATPMDWSTPGFPVHHQLPELAQTHVRRVSDAIQPSHPVIPFSCLQSFPESRSFLITRLFTSGSQSIRASASASVFPVNIQVWFPLGLTGLISLLLRDSQESYPTPQFESISSLVLGFLYGSTITFIHNYWKNHSFDYMDFCRQSNVSVL